MIKYEDKKIIMDKRSEKTFRVIKPIDYGSHADVYKVKIEGQTYALKLYNGNYIESLENCERKLNINIDSYVSPKKVLYIDDKFSGYIMKYIDGQTLERLRILRVSIDEFAKNSAKLLEDTQELSKTKYVLYDTFVSNVMYCKEGFKMIDMDDYIYQPEKTVEEVQKINNKRFNMLLIDIFIASTGLSKEFETNKLYMALKDDCISSSTPFEALFNYLCMKAYSSSRENIETLQDIGKVLKKQKN